MNVASKDLSRELYELTKWVDDSPGLEHHLVEPPVGADLDDIEAGRFYFTRYTLGYLLRKLSHVLLERSGKQLWIAVYTSQGKPHRQALERADTPEDAACKLLIELIKQGVICPNGELTK